jgi:hypothetical protein
MYLLDANVFIQAKNLHYGFDFCPAFWEWLVQQHEAETVFSVEKVLDELKAGADPLSEWAEARPDFFVKRMKRSSQVSRRLATGQQEPAMSLRR